MYTTSPPADNTLKKIYSISELSNLLKGVVETHFTGIQVKAELSSVKRHTSGHIYFALKDDQSVMDAVCWKGVVSKLLTQPQDGLEVICTGRLTTYPGRSKYQMIVETMELAGEGALLKLLEDLKKKLAAEGLFAQDRKQAIPFLPRRIGIVTSPTGAVIQDILHRLQDRFPVPVLLWPVPVQGEGAAQKIAAAIDGFNALAMDQRPDVLIVARGGGSLEDLWCFNEEVVVRAVANSRIPLISAVGHETDTTLIDYASDHRAPTPTAAAERAVPVRIDLYQALQERGRVMNKSMRRRFEEGAQRVDDRSDRLERTMQSLLSLWISKVDSLKIRSPLELIQRQIDSIQALQTRFQFAFKMGAERRQTMVETLGRVLESYSYTRTLERGFALVKSKGRDVVRSAQALHQGDYFTVAFVDGVVDAQVAGQGVSGTEAPIGHSMTKASRRPSTRKDTKDDSPQGSLF